ncbi:MAG: baseplate J/gp47 family protein [Chitinophagaceae bacterium]
MACNDQKNPLQHSGTSQQQHALAALQPGYILADEREAADWIVFASKFSEYLNYFNETNVAIGNWQPFFNNDIAATLGAVAIQDITAYKNDIKERLDFLRSNENESKLGTLESTLGGLFSAMLALSRALDLYLFKLPADHTQRTAVENAITQKLQPTLQKLIAYYKGGKIHKRLDGTEAPELVIIKDKDFPDWFILGMPVMNFKKVVQNKTLSPVWLNGKNSLLELYNSTAADSSIYGDENALPYQRIQHAANHNLFVACFNSFLSSYARIIKGAEAALADALSSFSGHAPHYTLFLTFIQLYKLAQDELNTFTQRHLDFYYQDVLLLSPNIAEANSAFLTVELAKSFSDFALPKGTLFKAGKDSLGQEVSYSLTKDTSFNQAQVAKLMSVYRGATTGINGQPPIDDIGSVNNEGRLFAAPFINSADGLGAALKTEKKEWQPFVNKTFQDGNLSSINIPKAAVGFALASSYLALAEGDREIQVKLQLKPFSSTLPATLHFDGYLTTAKKWLPVSVTSTVETLGGDVKDAIILKIVLDGNAPAITPYSTKVHGGTFTVDVPVLKLVLNNDDTSIYEYDPLKYLELKDVSLSVFVGVDSTTGAASKTGAKQLLLSNELGAIDPAKPFQPFGLSPKKGSSFIIGNEEFFKKPGATFELKFDWMNLPLASKVDYDKGGIEGDKTPNVTVEALSKGAWQSLATAQDIWIEKKFFGRSKGRTISKSSDILYDENTFPNSFLAPPTSSFLEYQAAYGPLSVRSSAGFVRLVLEAGFGYDDYQSALTKYQIKIATKTAATPPGIPPYVPKLSSISLHYSSTITENLSSISETEFEARAIEFYHLYPFGEAEQHQVLSPNTAIMLMPQFAHGLGEEDKLDSGEFYIGLTKLAADQAVNILFGVMEGTTDPLTVKPEDHVHWSYLSKNQWRDFDPQTISDGTAQLIQTGIISFTIPEDASTDNTMLPLGYLWLRASVNSATMAVCKLLTVDAQAAIVQFTNNNNAPDFLNLPLPAGTISKLKINVPAIKKISQTYASFGGRPTENPSHYYMRVSERLRHKDRAVNIWDYEHLILEAFPKLNRVKCLSHTSYEQLSNGTKKYNEVAPGHVTIITIPALENIETTNPLRPYTNESTLQEIDDFLRARVSCHVQTHVVHPLFEEVAMDFKLKLMPGYDDFTFYKKTLQEEITAFLTPWAFGAVAMAQFGGKVVKSVLINFIEERPYVDFITEVKMYHRTDTNPNSVTDTDEITATNAMAILVSVPALKHNIIQIPDAPVVNTDEVCIDMQGKIQEKNTL